MIMTMMGTRKKKKEKKKVIMIMMSIVMMEWKNDLLPTNPNCQQPITQHDYPTKESVFPIVVGYALQASGIRGEEKTTEDDKTDD